MICHFIRWNFTNLDVWENEERKYQKPMKWRNLSSWHGPCETDITL